jgi:hypothetical protein
MWKDSQSKVDWDFDTWKSNLGEVNDFETSEIPQPTFPIIDLIRNAISNRQTGGSARLPEPLLGGKVNPVNGKPKVGDKGIYALEDNEYVLNKNAKEYIDKKIGKGFLDYVNFVKAPRFKGKNKNDEELSDIRFLQEGGNTKRGFLGYQDGGQVMSDGARTMPSAGTKGSAERLAPNNYAASFPASWKRPNTDTLNASTMIATGLNQGGTADKSKLGYTTFSGESKGPRLTALELQNKLTKDLVDQQDFKREEDKYNILVEEALNQFNEDKQKELKGLENQNRSIKGLNYDEDGALARRIGHGFLGAVDYLVPNFISGPFNRTVLGVDSDTFYGLPDAYTNQEKSKVKSRVFDNELDNKYDNDGSQYDDHTFRISPSLQNEINKTSGTPSMDGTNPITTSPNMSLMLDEDLINEVSLLANNQSQTLPSPQEVSYYQKYLEMLEQQYKGE